MHILIFGLFLMFYWAAILPIFLDELDSEVPKKFGAVSEASVPHYPINLLGKFVANIKNHFFHNIHLNTINSPRLYTKGGVYPSKSRFT